ncbi:MAG: ABC transporter permease [Actinomycetota bacterium]|nr:ABC transporter permease [Actinomycetota bacterium]
MSTLLRLTRVELRLFLREPFALIFTFAFPLVVLVVLINSFPDGDEGFGGADPSDYYLAGYVGVVIAAVGLVTVPAHVAGYREHGVLRRFRASGVPLWAAVGAPVLVGMVMAAVGSLLLVLVGRGVYDAAAPVTLWAVLAVFVLAAASFLALGLLIAGLAPTARAAQSLGMLLFFPLWLLSGAGPPPEVMGDGMRSVSETLPLTFVVQSLQDPWLGADTQVLDLVVLAVLLVAAGALALRLLRSA